MRTWMCSLLFLAILVCGCSRGFDRNQRLNDTPQSQPEPRVGRIIIEGTEPARPEGEPLLISRLDLRPGSPPERSGDEKRAESLTRDLVPELSEVQAMSFLDRPDQPVAAVIYGFGASCDSPPFAWNDRFNKVTGTLTGITAPRLIPVSTDGGNQPLRRLFGLTVLTSKQ